VLPTGDGLSVGPDETGLGEGEGRRVGEEPAVGEEPGVGDPPAGPDPLPLGAGVGLGVGVGTGVQPTTVVLSVAALSLAAGSLTGLLTLTAEVCVPEPVVAGTL
jgi:hypothetical protein